jgi:hypothetical protein
MYVLFNEIAEVKLEFLSSRTLLQVTRSVITLVFLIFLSVFLIHTSKKIPAQQ